MKINLTQKQKELIEKFGVSLERSGSSPAQARVLSLLLVCEKAELTFDEIHLSLGISKSAASNAINSLLLMERIEYHTKPGDRKRYFVNRIGQIEQDFEQNLNKLLEVNVLLKEILATRSKKTKQFNSNLQRVIDFMEFLQTELPQVYKKWSKKKSK
ncbi:MAG: MarR family transcriptional regulator [Bacteroidota bacterium]